MKQLMAASNQSQMNSWNPAGLYYTCPSCGQQYTSATGHNCNTAGYNHNPFAQPQTDVKLDQLIALMNLLVTKMDALIDLFD